MVSTKWKLVFLQITKYPSFEEREKKMASPRYYFMLVYQVSALILRETVRNSKHKF